jgi:hypothetical protein
MAKEKNELIEMIVVRQTVCRSENVFAGDKIMVPSTNEADGVPPVRWWQYTRKAALTEAEAEQMRSELPPGLASTIVPERAGRKRASAAG